MKKGIEEGITDCIASFLTYIIFLIIFGAVFGLLGAMAGLIVGSAKIDAGRARVKERVQVAIEKKIEREIKVKKMENKFIETGLFSAAGGLGAPQIFCKTAKQFVDLVPENEPVYTAFEEGWRQLKKIYWAFIENRAGLMIYEDIYRHKNFRVERYTPEMVYFCKYETFWIPGPIIGFGIGALIITVLWPRVKPQGE